MEKARKVWESLGFRTEDKKGWNYGFIDGFDHMVYALLGLAVTYLIAHSLGAYGSVLYYILIIYSVLITAMFFAMEVSQAKNMRSKQVWEYWQFWRWHNGRHQDYGLPAIALTITLIIIKGVV